MVGFELKPVWSKSPDFSLPRNYLSSNSANMDLIPTISQASLLLWSPDSELTLSPFFSPWPWRLGFPMFTARTRPAAVHRRKRTAYLPVFTCSLLVTRRTEPCVQGGGSSSQAEEAESVDYESPQKNRWGRIGKCTSQITRACFPIFLGSVEYQNHSK